MKNFLSFEDFIFEKQKHHPGDPPEIGLYSKGGKEAIKGTGYANKEKAEYTIKELNKLVDKGEFKWAMSIATTMESRAKKHEHQTDGMRDAMKIFRKWIDANKKSESIEEGKGLFNPGDSDAVEGTGYGSKEKAEHTIKIINKLKKTDHRHAMSIATTMMNRAEHSANQTDGMKQAIPIFKKWIEDNKKSD